MHATIIIYTLNLYIYTYKMTPELTNWILPAPIWFPGIGKLAVFWKLQTKLSTSSFNRYFHIHLLCTPMHWIQTQQNIMQWHLLQKLSRSRHSNLTWVFNFPVGHYQLNSSCSSLRIFLGIRLNHAMSSDGVRWLWESISIFYKVHFWMTKRCIWTYVKLTLEKPFYIF